MLNQSLIQKIKAIRPSIVAIGFSPQAGRVTITGSGFCISTDGKILSAAHIYNQVPTEFQTKLLVMVMTKQNPDGLEEYAWLPINLIKKEDANDLAVFQIPDYAKTLLKPIEVGDSETAEVGQDVYFIGFPYAAQLMNEGMGITLVVSKGIVSNIKQDGIDPAHPKNWIIVDAISNPGNSGCPLLDLESNKVIGVMTIAFRTKSQVEKYNDLDIREPMNIAGAKPVNLAKSLLK